MPHRPLLVGGEGSLRASWGFCSCAGQVLPTANPQPNVHGRFVSHRPTCTSFPIACSSDFVRSDQLLSYISSHVLLPTANGNSSSGGGGSGGSGGGGSGDGSGGSSGSSGSGTVAPNAASAPALELSPELRRWELGFSQLEMQRACGRGSYGRVSLRGLAS